MVCFSSAFVCICAHSEKKTKVHAYWWIWSSCRVSHSFKIKAPCGALRDGDDNRVVWVSAAFVVKLESFYLFRLSEESGFSTQDRRFRNVNLGKVCEWKVFAFMFLFVRGRKKERGQLGRTFIHALLADQLNPNNPLIFFQNSLLIPNNFQFQTGPEIQSSLIQPHY